MRISTLIQRWPWRRIVSRAAFALALMVTLVALFYAVERWRWRAAWERYAAEALRRGVQLEQPTPPPEVPDELNVVKAPFFTHGLPPRAAETLARLKNNLLFSDPESGRRAEMAEAKAALLAAHMIEEDGLAPE